MKKLLVALALASAASGASAATVSSGYLYIDNAVATALSMPWGPVSSVSMPVGAIGYAGTLKSNVSGTFTATYLGQNAGFANLYLGNNLELLNTGRAFGWPDSNPSQIVGIGNSQTISIVEGSAIAFAFGTDNANDGVVDAGTLQKNGDANIAGNKSKGILFFLNTFGLKDSKGKLFDFLVGYDDVNSDNDFDDYVVGVSSVPVPAALPLLASALAAFGIARRKSKQA